MTLPLPKRGADAALQMVPIRTQEVQRAKVAWHGISAFDWFLPRAHQSASASRRREWPAAVEQA